MDWVGGWAHLGHGLRQLPLPQPGKVPAEVGLPVGLLPMWSSDPQIILSFLPSPTVRHDPGVSDTPENNALGSRVRP